jgi:hypothetical protein
MGYQYVRAPLAVTDFSLSCMCCRPIDASMYAAKVVPCCAEYAHNWYVRAGMHGWHIDENFSSKLTATQTVDSLGCMPTITLKHQLLAAA